MYQLLTSRLFLTSFGIVLIIALSYTYFASGIAATSNHKFISMSMLDSNMMAESYFPSNSRTIQVGDNLNWHLSVYNHMGNAESLAIRIKLLNLTDQNPDDIPDAPSPALTLMEIKGEPSDNSTWIVPINWYVNHADRDQEYTVIKEVVINEELIDNLDVRSLGGKNFRLIFELWRYDPDLDQYVFAWNNGSETKSMWNQIWFDLRVTN